MTSTESYLQPDFSSRVTLGGADNSSSVAKNLSSQIESNQEKNFTPANEIPLLKDFQWTGEIPNFRLRKDGFFEDDQGNLIIFRTGLTADQPLAQTQINDLFNSDKNSPITTYLRSTLGEGLYTANMPNAYKIGENPNLHVYMLKVKIASDRIFDCTQLEKDEDSNIAIRKLAVMGLGTRLVLHPPESVFKMIYQDAQAIKLFPELPYYLAHGKNLYAQVEDQQVAPRWLLVRDLENTQVGILGKQ